MAETMALRNGDRPDDDNHDDEDQHGAAAAVAHGMLTTVAEVLGRLEERLGSLEAAVARPDTSALEGRIDKVVTAVTSSVADAIAGEVRAALQAARADATQGVSRLADLLAERALPPEPVAPSPVAGLATTSVDEAALGALLDERLAAVTAGIAGLLAQHDEAATLRGMSRTLARVEAELAEARAESAMAVQAVAERLERTVADALVDPAPAVAERLAVLEATAAEARTTGDEVLRRAVGAVEAVVANAARIEAALADLGTGAAEGRHRGNGDDTVARLADRIAHLQESVNRSRGETAAAVDRLAGELQAALGAGMERLLTQAATTDDLLSKDLRTTLQRLGEVAANVERVAATTATLADTVARLASDDRARPLQAALEAASREQQDAIAALHTAVVRRIDGRTAALARALEGAGDIAPLVQRLTAATEEGNTRAESVERAVAALRDELAQDVGSLAKRQGSAVRLLERVTAALDDEHRRLEGVHALCQSVAGAVEQQAAVGSRVAELVVETRSALRGEVERLESTVQLDAAKRQQHDQARLAQLAAGVTEVVERETALVTQRVVGLAAAVESLRQSLYAHPDETTRV
jgi:hypothetical protein